MKCGEIGNYYRVEWQNTAKLPVPEISGIIDNLGAISVSYITDNTKLTLLTHLGFN